MAEFLSSTLSGFAEPEKDRDRSRSQRSSRYEEDERGHRSSRHRSRSRDRTRSNRDDRDGHRESSHRDRDDDRRRRDDDRRDDRSSRRYEDDRRDRDRPRDRDTNGRESFPPRRDDRDYRADRGDRRGQPMAPRDDRRPPPPHNGAFGNGPPRRDREPREPRDSRDSRDSRKQEAFAPKRSPTPEGTIPISKRKRPRTGWDVRASGFEQVTALQAKLTGRFNLPGQSRPQLPVKFSQNELENGAAFMPPIHFGTFADNFPAGITYARQARRLYVGGITEEGTEENIAAFFNGKMREQNLVLDDKAEVEGENPVIDVSVNHEKLYAFLELRSADEASAAMAFEGVMFQGQSLKIRRPKDYLGENLLGASGIAGVSSNVADSPNKVFVGGLPSYLTEDQVVELLKAFGDLKAFNLVKEFNGASKGFAFAEFMDPEVTDVACEGLNGMELGDRYLVVQRAAMGQGGRSNAGGMFAPPQDVTTAALRSAPNVIANSGSEGQPTRVVQLLNMVTAEDLVTDDDYNDIIEDIKEECGRFGEILELKIPRPIVNENGKMDIALSDQVPNLGKVFIMFESTDAAKRAMKSLAGRQFGGRTVLAAYSDEVVLLA